MAVPQHQKPGRPRKETSPTTPVGYLQATVSLDDEAVERAAMRRTAYRIGTNLLEAAWPDEVVIALSHAQTVEERGFAFWKDPLFLWKQFFSAQAPEDLAQASGSMPILPHLNADVLAGRTSALRPQDTWPPPPVIRALAWSPDGQSIASGDFDEDQTATVQVWQPG